jgi:tetratricopeptide (TPR) repeat protein
MGRSLAPIEQAVGPPGRRNDERVEFEADGLVYSVERTGSRVVHHEMRRDRSGRVVASIEADIQYAVGSGRQGISYLFTRGEFLFQSPITWYAKGQRFGLSPGYENRTSRFDRPILPNCLFCHANHTTPVSSDLNQYAAPVFLGHAIGCERCHGPGEWHANDPTAKSGRGAAIVNPAALEPGLRDAVCEQCHLLATRILRSNVRFDDFRPGMPFYQVWSAFVSAKDAKASEFSSQPEQVRQSACYRASQGRLGCISCHDPHVLPQPHEKAAYFRQRCLQCHEKTACRFPAQARLAQSGGDDCVACHMPRGASSDNPHVAITDHRIPRTRQEGSNAHAAERPSDGTSALVNFHSELMSPAELEAAERERAIVLAQTGNKNAAAQALPLIDAVLTARPDDLPALDAKAAVLGRLVRPADGLDVCRLALTRDPRRASALEGAAYFARLTGQSQESIEYWKRAIAVDPWRFDYRGELAFAEAANRNWKAAALTCREALRLNPFVISVRRRLLQSYLHLGQREAARAELEIILGFDPPDRYDLLRMFTPGGGRK